MINLTKILLLLVVIFSAVNEVKTFNLLSNEPKVSQYNITDSIVNAKYSSLAYCDNGCIEKWNCKWSKQLPFQDPTYLYDNITLAAGFIGYRSDTKAIVLSFRGSSNKQNWIEDFNFQMVPYQRCKDCYIHAGFLFDFSVLSIKIYENIQKLSAKYPVERIVATGHSLGGALALVAGLDIKMNYGNKYEVEVHTFGQPRVGNVNLVQFMKNKINTIFRIIHYQDIIPHVPFQWLKYAHPPTEVFFSEDMQSYKICNQSGQDPECSNQFYPNYSQKDHDFYFFEIDGRSNCKVTQ